jgi:hypothetical protein
MCDGVAILQIYWLPVSVVRSFKIGIGQVSSPHDILPVRFTGIHTPGGTGVQVGVGVEGGSAVGVGGTVADAHAVGIGGGVLIVAVLFDSLLSAMMLL